MPPQKHIWRAPRLPGLDLIRASAIVWVMFYHGSLYGLTSGDNWFVKFGWMGVDLFFVLSGFLIAGQLLRPFARGERPNYARFFGRRVLRTLPAYLVVVALYFALPALRDRPIIQPLWQFLTFTENLFADPSTPKAFSHVWSLCVEEQFYLLFPCVVALIALRPSPRFIVLAFVVVLLGDMALRGWLWLSGVARTPFAVTSAPQAANYMRLIYYPTWSRLDGLVAGIAAACVQVFKPGAWRVLTARPNLLLAGGIVGVVASTIVFGSQIAAFWPTMLGFPLLSTSIAAVVIAGSVRTSLIGRWSVPGAGALATGAYSLYLIHKAVFHAVASSGSWPFGLPAYPFALAGALLAGAVLYWVIERPFLLLRDRREGRSRTSLAIQS